MNAPGVYRRDIDGLRAVAITAVVAFHAFPRVLPGGFVGVDVFFVISGFLISGIILRGVDDGSFSFAEFYARRVKRIFPALVTVLAACLVFGYLALLPAEYTQLGRHAVWGAGFLSNFAFWQETGYFDNAAETKPLLHLWSLGVEEQFYLLWPVLLVGANRLGKGRALALVCLVGALSFAANVSLVGEHRDAAFYSPLTRFWELLVGSVLAFAKPRLSPAVASGASVARADVEAAQRAYRGAIALIAGMTIIETLPSLCDASRCPIVTDGVLLYVDGHHLSVAGSHRLARVVLAASPPEDAPSASPGTPTPRR